MFEWLGRWLVWLGLDFGYFPKVITNVLTYVIFNGLMIIMTGGLWVFWMLFRDIRKFRRYRKTRKNYIKL